VDGNVLKAKDRVTLLKRVTKMPWYVEQFVDFKLPTLSPSSLLEYVRDYETFFGWLIAEGLSEAQVPRDVTLAELEKLRMEQINAYRIHLMLDEERMNKRVTIGRKLSSLRSLFHYLSQIAEDEEYYPLLKRNVMAKVSIKRTGKAKDTAAKLAGKILIEEEIEEFIAFVAEEYGVRMEKNKQALFAYEQNRVRDTCLISLILRSGLRVAQVVNLDIGDYDLDKQIVYVFRKGDNDETFKAPVYFRADAADSLRQYMALREDQYRPQRREKALFLALANGRTNGSRMTKRAIQQMVIKYARAFGKPYLSVHKLRHSFATDYYLRNDLYKTQEQLGHASPETTEVYAHLTDKTMREAIDRVKGQE
jgi:site-specific recombinase XerD